MINDLIKKIIIALKQGNFFQKLSGFLIGKVQKVAKIIKKRYCRFNGAWYHSKTAETYEETRLKQDWWHEENRILSEFLKSLPKGIGVLDVPFGTARFLPIYNENQFVVTGIDISRDMLKQAKELRGDLLKKCTVDIGDARALPYENNSFDLIVSFRFLDGHVIFKDAKTVISEFCRVSKKYLILELGAVPSGDDSEFEVQKLQENQPIHGRLSESERIKFLRNFGLRIIKRESACREGKPFVNIYLCEKD